MPTRWPFGVCLPRCSRCSRIKQVCRDHQCVCGRVYEPAVHPTAANPTAQGVISILSLAVNVVVFGFIMKKAKETKTNPYRHEIFTHQKDFQLAMSRAEGK